MTAWSDDARTEKTVHEYPLRIEAEVEDTPIIELSGEIERSELEAVSDAFERETGKKPLIFTMPIRVMKLRRMSEAEFRKMIRKVGGQVH